MVMQAESMTVLLGEKLEKDSHTPLYHQVETLLEAHINGGDWIPEDRLPTEDELCAHFDVSRTVIRRSLLNLENRGLIWRSPGKGTFVARPKVRESLIQTLRGFHEDTLAHGHTPSTRILEKDVQPAPEDIARLLDLRAGTPVVYLKRLRFVDDEPHLISETYLRLDLCPGIVNVDFASRSLYAVLEADCGVTIQRGTRVVEAIAAPPEEASLLQIEPGAPLLLLRSLMVTSEDIPFEYSIGMHRADRSRFEIELLRTSPSQQHNTKSKGE